jgi:mono/diheme cytochrome c family protein
MRFKLTSIFFIFLFIFDISNAHTHFPITRDSEANIFKGKILYEQHCASCHMVNLVGAADWKGVDKDGHRKAPPLNGTGHTWHHSDEILHKIIKLGFAKLINNYEGKMYGFGEKINDEGIDNVLSYIKSYWADDIYQHQISMSK